VTVAAGQPGTVAAVVLGAGRGSRFGGAAPKQLARLGSRSLVGHALAAAVGSQLEPVLLVVGYRGEEVASLAGPRVEVVENPEWEEGLSSSLRCALVTLLADPAVSAAAVALADQPRIGPEAYRKVAAAHRQGASLAVATYGGMRGHPVLIGRSHWEAAIRLTGDEGARPLLGAHPVVEVPCDGTGRPDDVDTPDDLARLAGRYH
jgi:CTP:molybdopterin cytidylyltransferase MocA